MAIQAKRQITRYKDFQINFDIHPIQGDLSINKDDDSVKRSIKNLLFYDRYEKFWKPKFGAGLKAYLFENINSITAGNIRIRIIEMITQYEPRAQLNEVVVVTTPDNNAYSAKIVFSILNNPEPIILDTILERIR